MERTDQWGNKTAGSITSRKLYQATGQWREQTRGQTRQLGERRMHPAQEPQLASDMRHRVCLVQELGGLWIVESSCNVWFVWHDILID